MDNEPDPQPPEEVITQSDVEDPPEEVLSPSEIEWEEGETSLSYVGDDGKMYTVYREPQTKVSCNHEQDSLETHPGYPDPDESGPQLSLVTLESQPEESPEQGIILINLSPPEMNSGNLEWDKVKRS